MAAAKRVLRYLCSTSGMGLVLGGRSPVVLTGHADASWADDQATQRSSQGYTFGLGSGSVSWRAARSSSVLGSSCEAEIYAGAMAAQELRWLTYLLTDLGEPPRSPPILYVDNKAMMALCREQRQEHRTKHIALRYFLARELQQRGQLRLAYVASEANIADVFTKALAPCDHQRCCTQLGLLCFALLDWSCDPLFSPTLPMGLNFIRDKSAPSAAPTDVSLPPVPEAAASNQPSATADELYAVALDRFKSRWQGQFAWLQLVKTTIGLPAFKCSVCLEHAGLSGKTGKGSEGAVDVQKQAFMRHAATNKHKLAIQRQDQLVGATRQPRIDEHPLAHDSEKTERGFHTGLTAMLKTKDWQEHYPNLVRLWVAVSVLPLSTVECERGFSRQNVIKSRQRGSLKDARLSDLMCMSLLRYKPNWDEIVEIWHNYKKRKPFNTSNTARHEAER
ncbi:unnamed protein product [Closterium sp. NIES-53]